VYVIVVTGALPLITKRPGRHPDERVEPVEKAREIGDHARERVETFDMSELVTEDDANDLSIILLPIHGFHGFRRKPI